MINKKKPQWYFCGQIELSEMVDPLFLMSIINAVWLSLKYMHVPDHDLHLKMGEIRKGVQDQAF